ncbi:YetF domain-containing protein [Pallidibacillus thermolactis]|uniref:YetF domain-containing protein n=1 Tax=Pallidibacillus thermolactis TaxID=251051 RepID=UPI0021DADDA4|nr:DUF421 domain-containing protein [Pallidibacillus thermolactis]MCU9602150.1 DUF421 domain-containing protein [Pallidibacillus thermolactis subsp. kokeshiiformis]MED1672833.1 DUF421 domain-containing protein [Pallidibacillus thermolactis subsp. kokeshiiformis]
MPELIVIVIRSLISFIVLLLLTRLMGKRQVSQLTFFDYIVGITIGSIAAEMSFDQNVRIINGITSLLIWGLIPFILAIISLKSRIFQQLIDGKPTIIIKNGEILEKSMKKVFLSIDELMLLLREKNIFKISDVEIAILETNGQLSVLKKTSQQPVTPQMLKMVLKQEKAPTLLIVDGQILYKNLATLGYSEEWLMKEIRKQGATNTNEVFLAQVSSDGELFVDLYEDHNGS